MKRYRVLFFFLLLSGYSAAQQYSLSSPAGVNTIEIFTDGRLSYQVRHEDQLILDKSPVSIHINGRTLGQNPSVTSREKRSNDRTIRPVVREKRAEIKDRYNELELRFEGNYGLRFRAYDDGVAYRWFTALEEDATITGEEITFNFRKDHMAVLPVADGFFTHYERNYVAKYLNEMTFGEMSCLPAMVQLDGGVKVAITEADLYDYPGFYLRKGRGAHSLTAVFPRYPKTYVQPNDRNVRPVEREYYIAKTAGRRNYPWRLIVIADTDGALIENTLVYQLSSGLKLTDTDWIRPGKVAWDWYNANNIYGVDFKSGVNTPTYKFYIDFASQYGLEYIILDEGWYDIQTSDLLHPVPGIDMEELVAYGQEKNVGIILWVTWKALEDQFTEALDQFEAWGVKGIKVDFMQRDDQWMVNYYERVARAAADRKLLVDFHGSYKPSGLRRAYPNVISREGVKGLENNKWEGQFANPEYDVEIPFLRMMAGPVDYTPGAMVNAQRANYAPIFQRPMSLGTRCHQLAMYVVYESPLQMLADSPSQYLEEKECMEFLSAVPTVWDDTKVLDAKFGDYVLIARRHGNDWYVGAMTDWNARNLDVDFSFLGSGNFSIDIYQDGVNAERYASDYKKTTQTITSSDKMNIHLASGGGWAAVIKEK
jgi:alpha-glucosidase